jgi:hypothetical protein
VKAHVLTDYANCASIIRWRASDILIVLDDEQTDDPIIPAEITTPAGAISVMAAVAVRSFWF